jgi:hypothetical protein
MSDCGVCLSSGYDFGDNGFMKFSASFKTPMECCECGKMISAGVEHEKARYQDDDGNWKTQHTCPVCAEIAWAFFCDGVRLYSALWEYMEEVYGDMTTGCLQKLKTPEAKKELLRRWNEWKFSR